MSVSCGGRSAHYQGRFIGENATLEAHRHHLAEGTTCCCFTGEALKRSSRRWGMSMLRASTTMQASTYRTDITGTMAEAAWAIV